MEKIERLIKNAICPMYEAQKAKEDMKYQQKKTPFVFHADKFYEGMTKDDASKLKNSLFINYQKAFEKIDSGDGVLSAKEIEYAAYEDKYNGITCAFGGFSLAALFSGLNKVLKKEPLFKAAMNSGSSKAIFAGLTVTMILSGLYGIATAIKANNVAKQYS